MKKYELRLEHLSVGYGGRPLVSDINIDVQKGEIVTLIGPNGAGKSTILKSIIRQIELVGGKVWIEDTDMRDLSYKELSSKLSVVLTDRVNPELMTCRDVVAAGRYPYTDRIGILTADDELKVDEALSLVRAEDFADQDFNHISDGQRQRILLARAICQEPDVMVLDEPTSFLDIRHKLDILTILRNMAKNRGMTVIMSLHEIDLAMKTADKIMCVKGEHVHAWGTPDDIFRENTIKDLYRIDNGFFDPLFGSIELAAPQGEPQVFVISDSGRGVPVYRELQKKGIPFAAGILFTNDMDYRLARLLAAETVCEQAFMPISDENMKKAMSIIDKCGSVINAGITAGDINAGNHILLDYASCKGKLKNAVTDTI